MFLYFRHTCTFSPLWSKTLRVKSSWLLSLSNSRSALGNVFHILEVFLHSQDFFFGGLFFFSWLCAFPFLSLNLLMALPNLYPIFWIVLSTSSRDGLIKIWFPVLSMFQASMWKVTSFNECLFVVFLAFLYGIHFKCSSVFYFFFSTEIDLYWGIGNVVSD